MENPKEEISLGEKTILSNESVSNEETLQSPKEEKTQKKPWVSSETRTKVYIAIALISLISSIVLSMIMLRTSERPTLTATFSSMGARNRPLFFFWGVSTSIAVYMNIKLLAKRLQFKNKFFEIVLIVGCANALITASVIGQDTARSVIHNVSAMVFGFFCLFCLLVLMVYKFRCKINRKRTATYITAISLCAVAVAFMFQWVGNFTAFTQTTIINVGLITMFLSNFVEKWSLQIEKQDIANSSVGCDHCEKQIAE